MNGLKETIRAHPLFCEMKPEHLDILVGEATTARFNPGEILFREGNPADHFYLIESGRIALEAHEPAGGTLLIENLGAGDVLGWSWLLPPYVWHFGARAVEPARAIVLSGAHLLVAAERNHEFGYELMKRVAQVIIQRLQATRKLLLAQQIESVPGG
jgi:CRP-like cAMP-binding protein